MQRFWLFLWIYSHIKRPFDVNELTLRQIQHFFEHYKDLEAGKWVKVDGWGDVSEAHLEISNGAASYQK